MAVEHMIRNFWKLALAVMVAAWAAGCGGSERSLDEFIAEDGRITVEFWHAMSGGQASSLNTIIDQFNDSQDQYYVKGVYQGGYSSLSQKLIASLYGGKQPAASQMYESWATRFLKFQCLQPVDYFIRQDTEWRENGLPDMFETLVENNSYYLVRYEDGTYRLDEEQGQLTLATLPANKSVYVLYVNETMMRELGFEEPPGTWAELRALADAMTIRRADGVIERYGYATRRNMEALTPFVFMTGQNYMDENDEFTFTEYDVKSAMEFVYDLVVGENSSGYVEPGYLSNVFGNGRVGMYIGSTASFPFNNMAVGNKFIWRAYPLPVRQEGDRGGVLSQGTNVGLFRAGFSGNGVLPKEVQQGAWEFLKYLVSPEITAQWAMDTGYMPVRRSASELPKMQEFMAENENFTNAFSQLDRIMFEPKPIWWDNVRNILNREVPSVLDDRKTVPQALASAQERARVIQETGG